MGSQHYPSLEELLSSEKEHMLQLNRSPRSMLGLLSWAVITALMVTILCYYFGHLRISEDTPGLNLLSTYWFYIGPVVLAVEAVRRYHDDLYIFEPDRITHQGGRLSLQYSVPAVRYIDVRAIGVNQSFTGRIFDYGDVEVNTAALDDGELYIDGVRAPDELGKLIEQIRSHHQKNDYSQDG